MGSAIEESDPIKMESEGLSKYGSFNEFPNGLEINFSYLVYYQPRNFIVPVRKAWSHSKYPMPYNTLNVLTPSANDPFEVWCNKPPMIQAMPVAVDQRGGGFTGLGDTFNEVKEMAMQLLLLKVLSTAQQLAVHFVFSSFKK